MTITEAQPAKGFLDSRLSFARSFRATSNRSRATQARPGRSQDKGLVRGPAGSSWSRRCRVARRHDAIRPLSRVRLGLRESEAEPPSCGVRDRRSPDHERRVPRMARLVDDRRNSKVDIGPSELDMWTSGQGSGQDVVGPSRDALRSRMARCGERRTARAVRQGTSTRFLSRSKVGNFGLSEHKQSRRKEDDSRPKLN